METVLPPYPDTLSQSWEARHNTTIGLTADPDHEGSEVPFSVFVDDGWASPFPVNGSQWGIPS